jgi:hypothetical protein
MLLFGDFCYLRIFKKVHSISGRSLTLIMEIFCHNKIILVIFTFPLMEIKIIFTPLINLSYKY